MSRPYVGRHPTTLTESDRGARTKARSATWYAVSKGAMPHANTLPCVDCGHVWQDGDRPHEYDHHLGYDPEHHLDVQPVCGPCHMRRDSLKLRQTHCVHGHEYTPENTLFAGSARWRYCATCKRMRDQKARAAGKIKPTAGWRKRKMEREPCAG